MQRCISLWQPWASLCCIPHPEDSTRSIKGFETRPRAFRHEGPLLIHAAKRFTVDTAYLCHEEPFHSALLLKYPCPDCLPTGAIIGCVVQVGCERTELVRGRLDRFAWAMGDYTDGRWAYEFIEPELFETPIPYRGQQFPFWVSDSGLRSLATLSEAGG